MVRKCIGIWNKIKKVDELILDALYPPRCIGCDEIVSSEQGICVECRKQIKTVEEPVCMKCGKPLLDKRSEYCGDCSRKKHVFSQGKALWVYEKGIKKSLYRFKYQNKREYGKIYAREIAKKYGAWIERKGIQAIVPVPLHKNRKRKRGYNQAEIIARELGDILKIPVHKNILIRIKDTAPQKRLNDTERKNNLKKAFKTTKSVVQLQYVLVIDDIYTTGSTVDAVSSALLQAGVQEVYTCCVSIGEGC